jgi:hypothetical protein
MFSGLKGLLVSAFAFRKPETPPAMPETFPVPRAWPEYLTRHIVLHSNENGENQMTAAKWDMAIDLMVEGMGVPLKDREQELFLKNLRGICAAIMMTPERRFDAETGLSSGRDYIDLKTEELLDVYRSSYIFDDIARALAARQTDLNNVVSLRGAAIMTGEAKANIVSEFKGKYIEMMEGALLPEMIQGWRKPDLKTPQPSPEVR